MSSNSPGNCKLLPRGQLGLLVKNRERISFFPPKHRAMFNPNPRSCVNDPTVNVSPTPVVVTPRERLL